MCIPNLITCIVTRSVKDQCENAAVVEQICIELFAPVEAELVKEIV